MGFSTLNFEKVKKDAVFFFGNTYPTTDAEKEVEPTYSPEEIELICCAFKNELKDARMAL